MILQVNNTFDERRIYLLSESEAGEDVDDTTADSRIDTRRKGHGLDFKEDARSGIPAMSSRNFSGHCQKIFTSPLSILVKAHALLPPTILSSHS